MFVSTAFAQAATESQPEVSPVDQNGTVNQNGLDSGATQGGEIVHTEIGVAQDTGASGVFPPFDSTHYASQLLWLAITFGLFYLFMARVVLPRIGGVIETRRDRIEQDLEQAARLKTDADNAIAAYEQELTEARRNAAVIGQEARDQGKAKIETERAAVEATLEAKLSEAEDRIAAIKTKAMAELGTIAQDTASEIVEKLLGDKPEDAEVAAAVKAVSA